VLPGLILRNNAGNRGSVTAVLFSLTTAPTAFAQASKISRIEVRLEPAGDTGENDLFGGAVAGNGNGNTMATSGEGANSAAATDTGAASP
jgi:hypothetical protein